MFILHTSAKQEEAQAQSDYILLVEHVLLVSSDWSLQELHKALLKSK